jgi:hypothetical protein
MTLKLVPRNRIALLIRNNILIVTLLFDIIRSLARLNMNDQTNTQKLRFSVRVNL